VLYGGKVKGSTKLVRPEKEDREMKSLFDTATGAD
jgi:hypothetical protein